MPRKYIYRKQMSGLLDFHGFREQTEEFLNGIGEDIGNLANLSPSVSYDNLVAAINALDAAAVHKTGNESISDQKTFAQGPYGTTSAVSASAINLADGCVFTKTISADTTLTFSGVPTGKAATFNLVLTNGGAYTVTWPASVRWSGSTPPELTASGVDVLTFLTGDGGASWYGTVALKDAGVPA